MSAQTRCRPQPRAEIMAIDAYVPGKSARRRARQGPQAVVQRIAARSLAARDRGVSRRRGSIWRSIPTARRGCCARRSPGATGSTPGRSSAATARTSCWRCSRTSICGPGDEGPLQPVRLSRISDRHPRRGRRRRWSRDETRLTANVDAMLAKVDADGRRSSISPIPTTRPAPTCRSPRSSGCTPACPATRCSCSTPPTPNMSRATITPPASNWCRHARTS